MTRRLPSRHIFTVRKLKKLPTFDATLVDDRWSARLYKEACGQKVALCVVGFGTTIQQLTSDMLVVARACGQSHAELISYFESHDDMEKTGRIRHECITKSVIRMTLSLSGVCGSIPRRVQQTIPERGLNGRNHDSRKGSSTPEATSDVYTDATYQTCS